MARWMGSPKRKASNKTLRAARGRKALDTKLLKDADKAAFGPTRAEKQKTLRGARGQSAVSQRLKRDIKKALAPKKKAKAKPKTKK